MLFVNLVPVQVYGLAMNSSRATQYKGGIMMQ